MNAAVIHEYGGPEVLKYETFSDPVVKPGAVLVRVAAAGINPVDTFERAGATKDWNPFTFPTVIGWDVSGTVVAVGPDVTGFAVGDKVCAWASHTYADLCVVEAHLLARVPEGLDLIDAAALPLVSMTGGQLISVASGVRAGQTVLVAGASGGVGRSAALMAKELGATVIAGVQKKQLSGPKIMGADRLVALDDDGAMGQLEPVDTVANTVRGRTAEMLLGKVKAGGVFASATGAPANAKDHPSVRVVSFVSKQDAAMLSHFALAAREGKHVIPIDRRMPLRDASAGHIAVSAGGIGKVLLIP